MTPPRVSVPLPKALWMIERLAAPSEMAPVFCVRLALPLKFRLPPKVIGLVMVAPTIASSVPPLMISVPGVEPLPPKA